LLHETFLDGFSIPQISSAHAVGNFSRRISNKNLKHKMKFWKKID